jgi:hypothetical protein
MEESVLRMKRLTDPKRIKYSEMWGDDEIRQIAND